MERKHSFTFLCIDMQHTLFGQWVYHFYLLVITFIVDGFAMEFTMGGQVMCFLLFCERDRLYSLRAIIWTFLLFCSIIYQKIKFLFFFSNVILTLMVILFKMFRFLTKKKRTNLIIALGKHLRGWKNPPEENDWISNKKLLKIL